MIKIQRTTSDDPGFRSLTRELDAYLTEVFGEVQTYYAQFNTLTNAEKTVVVFDDEIAVGCGCLREFDAQTVELKRMFVAKEYRNKGIAASILLELEKWGCEVGYKKMILETGSLLNEAISFYQKHAYKIIPKWGQYIGLDMSVCMEKQLQ